MLLTRKSTHTATPRSRLTRSASAFIGNTIDRRTFLKRSGLAAGGAAALSQLPFPVMRKAQAAEKGAEGNFAPPAHADETEGRQVGKDFLGCGAC